MASPYQQQALRRKLIYLGLILLLFTVSGIFRVYAVEARADQMALREQKVGEVEVGGSMLQLSLTGSRGFVVCALWNWALDAQKKNRWNELELYTKSLTRLQPHFITPWLFQSWNLSYNVSVQMNQVKDSYFYISEGVRLLSEGERKNHYQPTIRDQIGFTQQHKIMLSDQTSSMRCLFQMSCIPLAERDPERFWLKDSAGRPVYDADRRRLVNLVVFEEFCKAHPQLVRRLHDRLRCEQPADVVRFLEVNSRIPSLFVEDDSEVAANAPEGSAVRKPTEQRFPPLPPPAAVREKELPRDAQGNIPPSVGLYDPNELSYDSLLDDSIDAHVVARAWHAYAQECLVAPHPTIPGGSADPVDRFRQRKPKMAVDLFRNHPPRAQTNHCERLQDEGWFGPEGWIVTGWFPGDKFRNGERAAIGTGRRWSEESWGKSYELWKRRGQASKLILLNDRGEADHDQEKALQDLADAYQRRAITPKPTREFKLPVEGDPDYAGWQAMQFMKEYQSTRSLANFPHFFYRSYVEMQPELRDPREEEDHGTSLIAARRTLFIARQLYREGSRHRVAEYFESKTGLERLRKLMVNYQEVREDSMQQSDFYELEVRYIKMMQDREGPTYRRSLWVGSTPLACLPQGAAPMWPGLVQQLLIVGRGEAKPTRLDESVLRQLPVPEFLPGYSNLMQDEKERDRFKKLSALSSLMGVAAGPQSPAPGWSRFIDLVQLQSRSRPADQVPAVANLLGNALGGQAGALAGLADLDRLQDRPLPDLWQAPVFVPRALMRLEGPIEEGGPPLIDSGTINEVRQRHGLLKYTGQGQRPLMPMPSGGMMPTPGKTGPMGP